MEPSDSTKLKVLLEHLRIQCMHLSKDGCYCERYPVDHGSVDYGMVYTNCNGDINKCEYKEEDGGNKTA